MYFSLVFREIRWWFFSSAFFFSFQGPVYRLQWSPFLSDAFLSCSADWSIRLWHQDKPQPIMTFISSTVSLKLKEIQSWWTSRTALHSSFPSNSVWPSLVYYYFFCFLSEICKWCLLVSFICYTLCLCQRQSCGDLGFKRQHVRVFFFWR